MVLDDLSFESFPPKEKTQLLETLKALGLHSGRVLITSTMSDWEASPSSFGIMAIPALSREESFQLLDSRLLGTRFADDEKRAVVEDSYHHPLALNLACSYILESEEISQGFIKPTRPGNTSAAEETPAPQQSILDLSLGWLKEENESSLQLLYLMSVLDIQGIPITLLTLCYDVSDDNWRLRFRRALRKLLSLSLIQMSHDQSTVFLNKSTQIRTHQKLESDGILGTWQQKAVEVLAKIFPGSDATYWRQCETLLPHVLAVLLFIPNDNDTKISRAILLRKLGKYNLALGDNDKALDRKTKALEIYQAIYGENDLETLEVEKEIANILYRQNKLVQAEETLIRVLCRYKASLPENHYLILTHYNGLNNVVQDLGRFELAEEYALKALQGYRQIYSPTHSDTLIAKWNLATLYRKTSRHKEARKLFEEILDAYREKYDETHPDILETISALASTLLSLNEHSNSIKMLQEAVQLALKTIDTKHPIFLNIQGCLASALSAVGRLSEAETIQRQILETNLLLHPAPEVHSLGPALNLACTLEKLSRFEEALEVLEPALNLAQDILTPTCPTHPTLLRLQNSLALVCLRLGRNAGAESQFRQLVETNKLVYGENGEQRLIAMNNLGGALQRQEKYVEAVQALRDALQRARGALGEEYRLTMRVGNNLAESLRLWAESGTGAESIGELLEEAEELHRGVLKSRKAIFGEGLDVWVSSVNLGTVLQAQGNGDEAKEYFDVLAKLEGAAGSENEVVKRGKERLALLKKGRSKETENTK